MSANPDLALAVHHVAIGDLLTAVDTGWENSLPRHQRDPMLHWAIHNHNRSAEVNYDLLIMAHKQGDYEGASHYMRDLHESLGAMYQVAHYNTGKDSPLTQAFATHFPKVLNAGDKYREATFTRDTKLGDDFEGIMKNSNLNGKQFD